jgi:hypothetical protein
MFMLCSCYAQGGPLLCEGGAEGADLLLAGAAWPWGEQASRDPLFVDIQSTTALIQDLHREPPCNVTAGGTSGPDRGHRIRKDFVYANEIGWLPDALFLPLQSNEQRCDQALGTARFWRWKAIENP